jgi:hypothetical protein
VDVQPEAAGLARKGSTSAVNNETFSSCADAFLVVAVESLQARKNLIIRDNPLCPGYRRQAGMDSIAQMSDAHEAKIALFSSLLTPPAIRTSW